MGRHRAVPVRFRWHRSLAPVVVPPQRRSGIELVDALTRLAHQVSPEELLAGRARGDYQGLCGARIVAASLTDPGRGHCPACGVPRDRP